MDTDSTWNIPDPLSLDVHRQLGLLLELIPQDSPFFGILQGPHNGNALLNTLSRCMLHPSLTLAVTWTFRPLLLDLCARWLDDNDDLLEKLEAFSLLIEVHEEIYPILSSFLRRDHFLDRGIRWLAIRCYALQSNMSDRKRENMERNILGEIGLEDCLLDYGEDVSGVTKKVDGWMLPLLEVQRIQDYRDRILNASDFAFVNNKSYVTLTNRDLSPRIANVHGILLPRTPTTQPPFSTLVLTVSALTSLRKIAVNISLRRPTLLTSTPSSGKTAFLNHLALLLHPSTANHIVTIHLADTSLDPRSLLGSYVSSSAHAGSFEWKDGVLVKAMREGKWVVLKDIDRASGEVLGLISPLVESLDDSRPIGSSAVLPITNRGSVRAAESFTLFATRSVEGNDVAHFPPPSFLGAQKWREVTVPENSPDDLRLIVDSKFPKIAGPVTDHLIDVWQSVKRLRLLSSSRPVGLRDLEKFCGRVSHLLESSHAISAKVRSCDGTPVPILELLPYPSLREEMYLEARDTFFAAGATNKSFSEQRDAIARMIGVKLGLSEETCEWVLKRRTTVFEVEKDIDGRPTAIKAGRTVLAVNSVDSLSDSLPSRSFSMHKQAIRLISQLAACVSAIEPVLLTGETGTGKTSVISYLASLLNRPLISLNLSNQTEASDLIGGFRPVSARTPALELQQRFTDLFQKTFSSKKNEIFHQSLRKAIADARWKTAVKLWSEASRMALNKLHEKGVKTQTLHEAPEGVLSDDLDSPFPRKRRKLRSEKGGNPESEWLSFEADVRHFEVQHVLNKGKFAFHYVEGPLVKAIRTGAWVLLDEINLASPETLECISGLLQGPAASITLTEQGSLEPVPRHHNFRLFACMNPATDIGKRDLPSNIRARFTEIEVPPPDEDQEALINIISHYIGHLTITDKTAIFDVAQFYMGVKRLSESGRIADGSDHRPHYSMRTLSRALTFAADTVQSFGLRRALWEGFIMTFTMVLNEASAEAVLDHARRTLLSSVKNTTQFLSHQPSPPQGANSLVQLGPFWLSSGPNEKEDVTDYILTPSVQKKLVDLARIIMVKRYPILIEGPTSSGKTSAIQYLARRTGHAFVRINNHEHTDIQEYLGSYVSDPKTGKLVFRDGLLVRALRRGDWLVLDELNLAPTDVLEALNRLLDDNRELVIPETQEVIRPHPRFVLFATQNPSGVYAGRKVLSRALRNRFLEVHFDDVPPAELEHILCQKSRIAPSYSQRIVAVFHELQKRRQIGRVFEGKQGFATLRDLFRWADRDAQGYQELAENGYMLLAERTRHDEDKAVVKEVMEKVMNVSISADTLYDTAFSNHPINPLEEIVWTKPMRRLFVLLSRALRYNEPVLLVGETGSGKTSVCQIYAEIERRALRTVNCHQNTEASDIIGGLRPVRREVSLESDAVREAVKILRTGGVFDETEKDQIISAISSRLNTEIGQSERNALLAAQHSLVSNPGLLEWQDGPLVTCMRSADVFLLDEISLADDSVLERLNSVLEPSRTLVLAERGGENLDEFQVTAELGFKFVATMNPGGDFGKKELSPALRNRFTEIWVPSIMKRADLFEIVKHSWKHDNLVQLTEPLLDFVEWIMSQTKDTSILTVRDILSWVNFCNVLRTSSDLSPFMLFVHGGQMAIVDGLSSLTQLSGWSAVSLQDLRNQASRRLEELSMDNFERRMLPPVVTISEISLQIGPFLVPLGTRPRHDKNTFNFEAPTSLDNAFRLIRACQIVKPILLEGSPGVGKTSLVSALAAAAGQRLCRINLSEQTDLVDLFGSDLPVEGDTAGKFAWTDAEFLQALKNGYWVLLDEMNLASQSVLEGLNAVFDHRGTVYVPELDRTFSRHPNFRVFAAQNPSNQGSGRKGLPKSFLNRFTKVFVDQLLAGDLLLICRHLFPDITPSVLQLMIDFNCRLHDEVVLKQEFGVLGSPWEFNLRDIIRWASLMVHPDGRVEEPWKHFNTIYGRRFRCENDRRRLVKLFADIFHDAKIEDKLRVRQAFTSDDIACGSSSIIRGEFLDPCRGARLLLSQSNNLEAALSGISHNWLLIITGHQATGKTSFARSLASAVSQPLQELSLGGSSDTSDLIGSYEQINDDYHFHHVLTSITQLVNFCFSQIDFSRTNAKSLESLLRLQKETVTVLRTRSLNELIALARSAIVDTPSNGLTEPLRVSLEIALESLMHSESGPRFEWVDGPLVRAMKNGEWLLLDNANLCSPSVLDRLNSLCELGGSLTLTEKGLDQDTLIPHRDFRLIMTVDCQRGDISRAMRNRGIEITLDINDTWSDPGSLLDAQRLPLSSMVPSPLGSSGNLRSTFELSRRALYSEFSGWPTGEKLSCVTNLVYSDSLSSRLIEYKSLIMQYDSTAHNAIFVLLLGSSSVLLVHHLLRLLKSIESPFCSSLYEDIRSVLCEGTESFKLLQTRSLNLIDAPSNQPFLHFLAGPFVHWLSEDDSEDCRVQANLLEAHALATILERRVRWEGISNSDIMEGRVDMAYTKLPVGHENIAHFLEGIPVLVRKVLLAGDSTSGLLCSQIVLRLVHYAHHLFRAASQRIVDYSTLYTVSGWTYDCIKGAPQPVRELEQRAYALRSDYILLSGQKLVEIWSSFYRSLPTTEAAVMMQKLKSALLSTRRDHASKIRSFELISLLSISGSIDKQHLEEWDRLKAEGYEYLKDVDDKDGYNQNLFQQTSVSLGLLVVELDGLAHLSFSDSKLQLKKIIHAATQSCSFHLHYPRMLSYQQLVWRAEAQKDIISGLVRAHLEWHKAVWEGGEALQVSGPSMLFTPIQLRSTVSTRRGINNGTLDNASSFDAALDDEIRRSLIECSLVSTREELIVSFLLQSIVITFCACSPSTADDDCPSDMFEKLMPAATCRRPILHLITALQEFKNTPGFGPSDLIVLSLNRLESSSSETERLHALGRCWIALSRTLLSLYVPNLSLDPVEIYGCRSSFYNAQKIWLSSQIRVHSSLETIKSGNSSNAFTQFLQDRMEELENEFVTDNLPNYPDRNGGSDLLQSFWKEARGFLEGVISPERIDKFLVAAESPVETLHSQEVLLQDSISNFLQRMGSAYAPLQDLLPAIELALMQLRFGLRAIRHSMLVHILPPTRSSVSEIMNFPSAVARGALSMVEVNSIVQGDFTVGDALLLKLVGVAQRITLGAGGTHAFTDVRALYERFSSLWNQDITREAERNRQSESLYRSRPQDQNTDEDTDIEDKEIQRLFPIFTETETDADALHQEHEKRPLASGRVLNAEIGAELMNVHLQLFDPDFSPEVDRQPRWNTMRLHMVSSWTDDYLSSMTHDMDEGSLAFRLDLLRESKNSFRQDNHTNAYSFYHDPNFSEARRASRIVNCLREYLCKLIGDWPDQLVLHHLRDRCDNLLSMSIRSPVAKILGAVERLLLHTEDWEMFANRENSLIAHRQTLTALIVEWRKLELSGWRSILDYEAESFCHGLADWWFRLYDATVRGVIAASVESVTASEDTLGEYLDSLTPLLEDFVSSSSFGQFKERLRLIRSFSSLSRKLATIEVGPSGTALKRSSDILLSFYIFYSQFSASINTSLSEQRSVIEKDVQSLVLLATWRDVNVHALQQSAQRTHKQLYRRIRKFRELLRQPITDHLHTGGKRLGDSTGTLPVMKVDSSVAVGGDEPPSALPIPLDAPKVLRKFESVFRNELGGLLNPETHLAIDELCVSIFTIQDEFLRTVSPRGLSATDQKRWNGSLLTRKRRSWNDLLKELKKIGISPNVKPEVLQMHRNRRRVMEQPAFPICSEGPFKIISEKVDLYYYRSASLLSDLLQCVAKHHPDIPTRELQRGIAFFESTFSYALNARARVVTQIGAWNQVRARLHRLHALERSQGACTGNSVIRVALFETRQRASELFDALSEIYIVAETVSAISTDDTSIQEAVLSDLQHWKSSCGDLKERLHTLVQDVDGCVPALIFEGKDDLNLIRIARKHFDDICLFLSELGQREQRLGRFCNAIREWHSDRLAEDPTLYFMVEPADSPCDAKKLTHLLLVIAQDLLAIERSSSDTLEIDGADHIRRQISLQSNIIKALRIDTVLTEMTEFSTNLQNRPRSTICDALGQVLPFIDLYHVFLERHLKEYASWTKSLLKLAYIHGSLLRNLAQSGFCKPPDQEEAGAAEGPLESAEGTGLGQGAGDENVSKQIEDESQYEGIKDQDDEMGGQQNEDAGDDALDVDFDLAGALEDGPDQDSKDDDSGEAMSELDDEFGHDISDELDPVDENFWNDQTEDSGTGEQEVNEGEAKAAGETEMVAKDKEGQPGEEKSGKGSGTPEPVRDDEGTSEVAENFDQNEDTSTKDVPPEHGETDVDAQDGLPLDDVADDADQLPEESLDDEILDEEREQLKPDEELGDGTSEPPEDGADQSAVPTETAQDNPEPDDQSEGQVGANADLHSGIGSDADARTGIDGEDDTMDAEAQIAGENLAGLPPSAGNDSGQPKSVGESSEAADRTESSADSKPTQGATTLGTGSGQAQNEAADSPLPNPHRSLGDALREVRRRFDEIRNSTEPNTAEAADYGDAKQSISLEYAHEDSTDVDMQALGPAMEEEHAKLNKLDVLEEGDFDGDMSLGTQYPQQEIDSQPIPVDALPPNVSENDRNESLNQTEEKGGGVGFEAMEVDDESPMMDAIEQLEDSVGMEGSGRDGKVEMHLNKWLREGQPEEDGHRIWQLYDSLTQSLSFSLCEQLRLILEPTRATRLMGDFRTGKRLNMKKIIPYIASNYTKDKIWLRRVKPSQREYQVLIALDDSRSMAESHSIHLAFQTLALVSKALNRLEVGDLAIASFGEATQMLHGFDDGPFTDQTGTKVVEAFKFQQTATDVHSLLRTSVDVLSKGRERRASSSSSDLWQLEIIISDGICQDHEELRAIMRKAEEEHILIVFIVIDAHSDPSLSGPVSEASRLQNSIVHMNQATYRTVNGRPELHMQRYLDSFPFEFFVILKNVEALPDVLADTLRQFFERISAL
ncbi:hypothetical protein M0805_002669 [Coniferiporia weirii]|nr:hypothetical protein M0805_002669 [Coniferiporia weirii]